MKKIDVFLANWDVIKIVSPNEISEQPIYVINDDEIYAECFYKDYHYIKPNHVYYFYVNNKIKLEVKKLYKLQELKKELMQSMKDLNNN